MKRRREEIVVPQPQEEKVLDVTASMQGTLKFDDPVNLRISGNFDGTLDTKGKLTVGEKATIKANITGEYVSVAGQVNGNIKATSLLELQGGAKLTGDVETSILIIKEGAVLNGNVKMTSASGYADQRRGDWMNVAQLGKYLEVSSDKIVEWAENGLLPGVRDSNDWVFDPVKVDQWIAEGKVRV